MAEEEETIMARTKAEKQERTDAIEKLRELIKPGDTVYTILDHVSTSGMSRAIRVVLLSCEDGKAVDLHPNWAIGRALGLRHWRRNGREQDALVVGGCGMDMGFHLVYELSHTLYGGRHVAGDLDGDQKWPDGFVYDSTAPQGFHYEGGYPCLGKGKCPSNYHSNHKDTIQCPGTEVYNPDGPNTGERCHWVSGRGWIIGGWGDDDDTADPGKRCPTCKGKGRIPNPDGPERFDLVHTDGYALRHRWL